MGFFLLETIYLLCLGLGTVSDSLLPFLGPVLDLATDLQQQAHIYLLEVSH
jgi:hypothetical protein